MRNAPFAVLWAASALVQLTVVVPIGKRLPDAGAQVTAVGPSTASVALARNRRCTPIRLPASRVILLGSWSTGGSTSVAVPVTVNDSSSPIRLVMPALSVISRARWKVPAGAYRGRVMVVV